ncbi:MAG: Dam family site-specific DNA-(adenine-N6)-methyltransferase [Polyangiaceae bacterium]|nr:Dam family site-specific DNA-(adenine-N6)-methyltransferase [Polyangiaceae bacterium]
MRPVIKWAGGKRRLVERLMLLMPPGSFNTYAEPFCGGAAMFFALAAEERKRFKKAILVDKNEDLIALYRAIQSDVESLVVRVKKYSDKHLKLDPAGRSSHYYDVRAANPAKLSDPARGARLLFLNKTCYNGLWRVNASGKNNVPFGRYATPRILDVETLRAASVALAGVDLRVADFASVAAELSSGDFAYFDPPYVPVSKTSNFTAYAVDGFGPNDQTRLASLMGELADRRVFAMLSNAWSEQTCALYNKFRMETIAARRNINSNTKKRGDVEEMVVMNYPAPACSMQKASNS